MVTKHENPRLGEKKRKIPKISRHRSSRYQPLALAAVVRRAVWSLGVSEGRGRIRGYGCHLKKVSQKPKIHGHRSTSGFAMGREAKFMYGQVRICRSAFSVSTFNFICYSGLVPALKPAQNIVLVYLFIVLINIFIYVFSFIYFIFN